MYCFTLDYISSIIIPQRRKGKLPSLKKSGPRKTVSGNSIKINKIILFLAGVALVAQLGRALSWYDRDRWFESSPGLLFPPWHFIFT